MQFSESSETSEISESMLGCETEFLDAGFECSWLHVEKRRSAIRPANSPVALLDGLSNDRNLGLVERSGHRVYGNRSQRGATELDVQLRPLGKDHRALDHVSQLADIARPVVVLKRAHRVFRDLLDPFAHRIAELPH